MAAQLAEPSAKYGSRRQNVLSVRYLGGTSEG